MLLKNITVKYGRKVALDNISLTLRNDGKIVGILGDNGSGKTTLVNLILKNINKFKGQREIEGSFSYMPDRYFLYESMTIKESIDLFKSVYSDFDEQRMYKILQKFSISPQLKLHDCSKGMHEQVHMALVFSRNTDFYVLDEPLSATDPIKRRYFMDIIQNYRRKNSTVLMVTHLIRDLGDMLEDVIFIKDGHILSHNSRAEILEVDKTLEDAYIRRIGQ